MDPGVPSCFRVVLVFQQVDQGKNSDVLICTQLLVLVRSYSFLYAATRSCTSFSAQQQSPFGTSFSRTTYDWSHSSKSSRRIVHRMILSRRTALVLSLCALLASGLRRRTRAVLADTTGARSVGRPIVDRSAEELPVGVVPTTTSTKVEQGGQPERLSLSPIPRQPDGPPPVDLLPPAAAATNKRILVANKGDSVGDEPAKANSCGGLWNRLRGFCGKRKKPIADSKTTRQLSGTGGKSYTPPAPYHPSNIEPLGRFSLRTDGTEMCIAVICAALTILNIHGWYVV